MNAPTNMHMDISLYVVYIYTYVCIYTVIYTYVCIYMPTMFVFYVSTREDADPYSRLAAFLSCRPARAAAAP